MSTLRIIVLGQPMTGKSTIAVAVAEQLSKAGIKVEIQSPDLPSPREIARVMKTLPERLATLSKNIDVTIEERQAFH